jgi:demethylmenaquinone methyltransferase/2-methoxy-6-polyprenyl-1,4-benzoquinol methylase
LALLDIAAGTADVLISLMRDNHKIARGVGIDIAPEMLRLGEQKLRRSGLDSRTELMIASVTDMPFEDGSFDVITIAFGVRNFDNLRAALKEIRRVLKPEGRLFILEFSLPSNRLWRWMHLKYLRHLLPSFGRLISGDSFAYRHLNQSIEHFPYGDEFCAVLREAGFDAVACESMTLGVASIYGADRGKRQ